MEADIGKEFGARERSVLQLLLRQSLVVGRLVPGASDEVCGFVERFAERFCEFIDTKDEKTEDEL